MATVTSPTAQTTLGVPPVSWANAVKTCIDYLLRNGSNVAPAARMTDTAGMVVPNNTATGIAMTAEDFDLDSGHLTTGGTNSEYVAQTAGYYWASGVAAFVGSATGDRYAWLAVNGSGVNGSRVGGPSPGSSNVGLAVPAQLLHLSVGDYVQLACLQTTGASMTLPTGALCSSLNVCAA